MTPLIPLLLPLVVGTVSAETPTTPDAPISPPTVQADLVEVHLGANTPGVRLVVNPPANAGPDAQPYVVEVFVPPWPDASTTAAPAAAPSLADEPVAAAPVMLSTPTTLAAAVPTASYATQPIEQAPPAPETAFLRHAPVDDLMPPTEPTTPQLGAATAESMPAAAPVAPKEAPIPDNWLAAAEHFEKACDNGYAQACGSLAQMVVEGQAGPPDMGRAYDLYQRGCDKGDELSCAAIAPTPASQPVAMPSAAPAVMDTAPAVAAAPAVAPAAVIDTAPAVAEATPAVAEAPAPAPAPTSAPVQPTVPAFEAEQNLFDACQHGESGACNELGERHTHGDGVSKDYDRAAKLFQRACAGGEMAACTNLGILYRVGEGVSQDELRAERLFQLACNGGAGDETACGLAED
jgi:hypothetical protein